MLNILPGGYRTCEGISRRSLLKVGALSFGSLGLSTLLRSSAQAAASGVATRDLNVILLWQGGGPSHLDMWDLKPQAPAEFRGTFNPIPTSVPGYQVGEHMPKIAKICDKLCIIRSCTHPDSGHESATHMLLTGYKPTNDIPAQEVPSYGSIVAKEKGPRMAGYPAYVAVPKPPRSSAAAYLGVAYNPFATMDDPNSNTFKVRNLQVPDGVTLPQLERRMAMLQHFDTIRRDVDASGVLAGMDSFTQQAWELVTSPKVQDAFDIAKEPTPLRETYGRTTMGQSMLMARRLVEAGVRFVTVDTGGWDTHANNFEALKTKKLPDFDAAYAALIGDLDERGLLDSTIVLAWGEFGRTPRINSGSGRDHWSNVFTAVIAGGGLKRGVILGESDARAEFPKERPTSPQDVLATMYHQLGINRQKSYVNDANRPVPILNYGDPIDEIIA